jgi:hypothetical protein
VLQSQMAVPPTQTTTQTVGRRSAVPTWFVDPSTAVVTGVVPRRMPTGGVVRLGDVRLVNRGPWDENLSVSSADATLRFSQVGNAAVSQSRFASLRLPAESEIVLETYLSAAGDGKEAGASPTARWESIVRSLPRVAVLDVANESPAAGSDALRVRISLTVDPAQAPSTPSSHSHAAATPSPDRRTTGTAAASALRALASAPVDSPAIALGVATSATPHPRASRGPRRRPPPTPATTQAPASSSSSSSTSLGRPPLATLGPPRRLVAGVAATSAVPATTSAASSDDDDDSAMRPHDTTGVTDGTDVSESFTSTQSLLGLRAIRFPTVAPGQQAQVRVQVRNTSREPLLVVVDPPLAAPFHIKHAHRSFELAPRSFVMLPIRFAPPADAAHRTFQHPIRVHARPLLSPPHDGLRLHSQARLVAKVRP